MDEEHVSIFPRMVEFRSRRGTAVRIIRVGFATGEPRITAWTEEIRMGEIKQTAISLSLREILTYIGTAEKRRAAG